MLAEKGTELGGPWSDHLEGAVWELRIRLRDIAARVTYLGTRGAEPTIALLRRLAAALDADVRLTAGHDLGSVWFETHAA